MSLSIYHRRVAPSANTPQRTNENRNTRERSSVVITPSQSKKPTLRDFAAFLANPGKIRKLNEGKKRSLPDGYANARDTELDDFLNALDLDVTQPLRAEDLTAADIKYPTDWIGATPLHVAARYRDVAVLEKLLTKVSNPEEALNQRDAQGLTVRAWADRRTGSRSKKAAVNKLLNQYYLRRGVNDTETTPAHQYTSAPGRDSGSSSVSHVGKQALHAFIAFLANPGQLRKAPKERHTMMPEAYAEARNAELDAFLKARSIAIIQPLREEDLIASGIKYPTDWVGATPLHIAARYRDAAVLAALLRKVPDPLSAVNLVDTGGRTVRDWANDYAGSAVKKSAVQDVLDRYEAKTGAEMKKAPLPNATRDTGPATDIASQPALMSRENVGSEAHQLSSACTAELKKINELLNEHHLFYEQIKKTYKPPKTIPQSIRDCVSNCALFVQMAGDIRGRVSDDNLLDTLKSLQKVSQLLENNLCNMHSMLPTLTETVTHESTGEAKQPVAENNDTPSAQITEPPTHYTTMQDCENELAGIRDFIGRYNATEKDIDAALLSAARKKALHAGLGDLKPQIVEATHIRDKALKNPETSPQALDQLKSIAAKLKKDLDNSRKALWKAINSRPELSPNVTLFVTQSQSSRRNSMLKRVSAFRTLRRDTGQREENVRQDIRGLLNKRAEYREKLDALKPQFARLWVSSQYLGPLKDNILLIDAALVGMDWDAVLESANHDDLARLNEALAAQDKAFETHIDHLVHQYDLLSQLQESLTDDDALKKLVNDVIGKIERHFAPIDHASKAMSSLPTDLYRETRQSLRRLAEPIKKTLPRETIAMLASVYPNWRSSQSDEGSDAISIELRSVCVKLVQDVIPALGNLYSDPATRSYPQQMAACEKALLQVAKATECVEEARLSLEAEATQMRGKSLSDVREHPLYSSMHTLIASIDLSLKSKISAIANGATPDDRRLAIEALSVTAQKSCEELEELATSFNRMREFVTIGSP